MSAPPGCRHCWVPGARQPPSPRGSASLWRRCVSKVGKRRPAAPGEGPATACVDAAAELIRSPVLTPSLGLFSNVRSHRLSNFSFSSLWNHLPAPSLGRAWCAVAAGDRVPLGGEGGRHFPLASFPLCFADGIIFTTQLNNKGKDAGAQQVELLGAWSAGGVTPRLSGLRLCCFQSCSLACRHALENC